MKTRKSVITENSESFVIVIKFIYLFVYLFIYLFIYVFIYLFVYLFIYLFNVEKDTQVI